MKLDDLLIQTAAHVLEERETAMSRGLDAPLDIPTATHRRTVGALHLYQCPLPQDRPILPDAPMTLLV